MSNPAPLQTTERDNTINPRQLRSAGFIPATLYGKGIESLSIQVREIEFSKLYGHGQREFELTGLPQAYKVKVQNVQVTSVKEEILSIEFLSLNPVADAPKKAGNAKKPEAQPEPVSV